MNQDPYICPITLERFTQPVIDPEGNTFEKHAIVEWINKHGTSPLTRTPMSVGQLAVNRVVVQALGLKPFAIIERNHSSGNPIFNVLHYFTKERFIYFAKYSLITFVTFGLAMFSLAKAMLEYREHRLAQKTQ